VKVLIVRLRLIGDVVLTTPLLRAITRRYPDARLTYAVEPAAVPVVQGNPHLTHIVVVPKRRGLTRVLDDISMARRLRRERFDVAIDLHGGPRASWFTWASGAPMRIGYAVKGRSWMYTHVVERPPDEAPRASVANQWDLLAPLDIGPPEPACDPLEMVEDPQAAASVERRLREARITGAHQIVVVHVSAGNPFRRWPHESFEALVVALARRDPSRRSDRRRPRCRISVNSTSPSCGPSSGAPRCTLVATADRFISPARRRRRSSRCWGRRSPSDRCRGATHGGLRKRSTRGRSSAGRAGSASASPATSAV
jgi:hypothetical protein